MACRGLMPSVCCFIGSKIEGSRLKFVDHHLRQQRALQQLGMIQHNAWRPQRGLPERSVSVLRAWLFEHFLHPYPKDSDKQMLAKQTGLTRSQVSNWFINARVRLWKPMVEEMYLEEIKDQEQNGSEDKTSKSEHNEDSASKSTAAQEKNLVKETQNSKSFKSSEDNLTNQNVHSMISMSTIATSPIGGGNARNHSGFSLIGSSELEGLTQGSPKKPRNSDMNMMLSPSNVPSISIDVKPGGNEATNDLMPMKFDDDDRQSRDGYSFIGNQMNFIQGFGQYPIGEIGRFDAEQFTPRFSGNGVSLTLGLPHCENLSLSATHQNFLPSQNIQLGRRVEIGEPNEFADLTNLRSLLLRYCLRLRRVPSVAKLLALHYLDLEATRIEEVPEGMEMLENLSYLYLYSLPLKKFPTGILPRLRDLYKLKLSFGREALRETVEEAARLSNRLDTFEGHFSTLKDFNIYVKSTDGRGSKNYCLLLSASDMRGILITDLEVDKSVSLMNCKICEREEPIVLPEDVQFLQMFEVSDVASLNDVLPREQGLVNIGKFSHDLKVLSFVRCPNLKNLFSLQLLPALQNLEVLKVKVCFSIEEIVVVEDEETEKELATNTIINTVTLPRLKRLGFYFLPEFKSFCSNNGVLVCNSLQEIEVRGCPKLKRLSLSLPLLDNGQPSPPAALKVIEIKKELWETLEWDQANAKDVLNPYCKFVGF